MKTEEQKNKEFRAFMKEMHEENNFKDFVSEITVFEWYAFYDEIAHYFASEDLESINKDAEKAKTLIESDVITLAYDYEENRFYHNINNHFRNLFLYDYITSLFDYCEMTKIAVNKKMLEIVVETKTMEQFLQVTADLHKDCDTMEIERQENGFVFVNCDCRILVKYPE